MNCLNLIGRLTREPEIKSGQSGKEYCIFSVAVNRPFEKDKADFFNCIAFGKTAEIINQYCKKGSQIGINGSIEFTTKDDKTYHSVKVNSIDLLGTKNDSTNNESKKHSEPKPVKQESNQEYNLSDDDDDEFPF